MTSFLNYDEIAGDFSWLMKRLFEFEQAVQRGDLKGERNVKQMNEPSIKRYYIRGNTQSAPPVTPFEPFTPWKRRPMPQRPFRNPAALNETREQLIDIFEEEETVTIYLELPSEDKENIQLNVTKGKVEVKTKNFYKMIDIPGNIDLTKASSKYNNSVLIITIPKKKFFANEKRTIIIASSETEGEYDSDP